MTTPKTVNAPMMRHPSLIGTDGLNKYQLSLDSKYLKYRGRWRLIQKDKNQDTFIEAPDVTMYFTIETKSSIT